MDNKKSKYKILFVGGDARTDCAADALGKRGCECRICERGGNSPCAEAAIASFGNFDAAVLPIPATRDRMTLNSETKRPLCTIAELLGDRASLIFAPSLPFFDTDKVKCRDLLSDPEYKRLNAVPTAEGAIVSASLALGRTIYGSRALVCGWGECAKALASRLGSLGASVMIAARREEARKEAEKMGFRAFMLSQSDLVCALDGTDIVFNTIPAQIFSPETIASAPALLLFCELASVCSLACDAADALGERFLALPALPARLFPKSAGEILARCVIAELEKPERSSAK